MMDVYIEFVKTNILLNGVKLRKKYTYNSLFPLSYCITILFFIISKNNFWNRGVMNKFNFDLKPISDLIELCD